MGLFSFLGKKNQDSSADVSGRFSRPDDEFAERARAKRASHAGAGARRGADDPVLPEKKRARRRLVGAIALALAAAVGLPMLLDSEPKPLAGDIAIQIPAKDKAAPLPMPAAPGAQGSVAASDSVDKGEEVVAAPSAKPAASPAPAAPAEASRTVTEVQAAPAKPEVSKPAPAEHAKPEAVKPEPAHIDQAKTEHKPAKPEPKDKPKKEDKPHAAPQDSARAVAILEGKEEARANDAGQKYVLQVIATGSQEKAAELQSKLRAAGVHSFTEKLHRPQGDLIRVKVGPFSRDEAEKVRGQLGKLGLSGSMSPA